MTANKKDSVKGDPPRVDANDDPIARLQRTVDQLVTGQQELSAKMDQMDQKIDQLAGDLKNFNGTNVELLRRKSRADREGSELYQLMNLDSLKQAFNWIIQASNGRLNPWTQIDHLLLELFGEETKTEIMKFIREEKNTENRLEICESQESKEIIESKETVQSSSAK